MVRQKGFEEMEKFEQYQKETAGISGVELIRWAINTFGSEKVLLASSLSIEDQLLTHWIAEITEKPRVLTLDTGRHFNETYEVMSQSSEKYGFSYELGIPDTEELRELYADQGINGFKDSVENRKKCCQVRKTNPLKKALATADIWITGLRAEQSVTRAELPALEWDANWNLYKINPLANWTEKAVWEEIENNAIPYSPLQREGYPSIGCACCTRAIASGEDIRAGRWWWENPEHKECGLHKSPAYQKILEARAQND